MIEKCFSRAIGIFVAGAAAVSFSGVALADQWPSKPITLVVPFTPGGLADNLGRRLAQHLSAKLKQPVVVENKPGAGTIIGSQYVARSKPDGYTFLLGGQTNVLNFYTQKKMPYARNDLQPVAELTNTPIYLVTKPGSPFKTVQDIVQKSKQNPGSVSCGNFGTGSASHLACGMLAHMAGIEFVHVSYKGGAPLIQDTMAGQVDVSMIAEFSFITNKKLDGIAVTTPKRSPYAPGIPSISETLAGYDITGWNGIFAPAGTPDAIVQRVAAETRDMLHSEPVKSQLETLGVSPSQLTPAEFSAHVDREFDRWGALVKSMNIKLE